MEVSALLNRHLRPYQRSGVHFLFSRCFGCMEGRIRGAVLADDMGMGKTVQVVALISGLLGRTHHAEEDEARVRAIRYGAQRPNRVFLVVSPASVLPNWEEELNR